MLLPILVAWVGLVQLVDGRALKQSHLEAQSGSGKLNLLLIGDYGFNHQAPQQRVAAQMDSLAAKVNPALVLSLGDNFYGPDGVQSTTDSNWNTHWYNVYKVSQPHLLHLPWHAILGNHDYCGNVCAQMEYKTFGWRMDEHFWTHTTTASGKSLAIVYVDTNLLAYGKDTQAWLLRSCPQMRAQFQQYAGRGAWTEDSHLAAVRAQLELVKGYDYIFVAGHHPVGGGACEAEGRQGDLRTLIESYPVSAYLHGHEHALSFSMRNGVAHVMSGAGADPRNNCQMGGGQASGLWQADGVEGFVHMEVGSQGFTVTYYDGHGTQLHAEHVPKRQ